MLRKLIMLIGIFISIFIIGCSNQSTISNSLTLEQSIKEIIISKGSDYNFLEDKKYMDHMGKLGYQLVTNKKALPAHYTVGNLNDDNIPELAVFQERDSDNMDDEGSLEIYQFNGDKYILLDNISMNFDNTNYQMVIGEISETQSGLFLNNQVGAHSGMTYGFILENDKLKSILNHDKISLLSVYTDNEIKDIDDDGILNFSILAIDPETEESSIVDSDKMTLWYKWNGKDSGELVRVQTKDYTKLDSNKKLFDQAKQIMDNDLSLAISFMEDNQNNLSKFDNTELLMAYIEKLNEINLDKSIEVNNLFVKYQEDNNFDYLFQKYGLTIEKLNSSEYLRREKVLKDEDQLKKNILDHIHLGYKLGTSEGSYYYLIDYDFFLDIFGENLTNEYMYYLNILALNTNKPFMNDGSLTISMEELADRILLVESFKMIYPHSNLIPEVHNIYTQYIDSYFYGDIYDPNFNRDTLVVKEEVIESYKKTIEEYEYTNFANIVRDFMQWLGENKNSINEEIREKLKSRLN